MRHERMIISLLLLCGLFFVSAVANTVSAEAAEKVTYRLKWVINMSTAGDIYAKEMGCFKQQGLAVEIKPGSPESDPIRELEMGHCDFGVVAADQAILALAKGAPIVVVAQLFQVNPLQWIYFADRLKISNLADLKGRRIGVTFGKNDEIIMRTLLARAGISERQAELFSVRLDYTPFYQKQVDLWPIYINSQGVEIGRRLEQAGEKIGFFNPNNYGLKFVANSVVTSLRILENEPDKVKRFITALLMGWRDAMDPANSTAATDIVQRFDRDTAREILEAQLTATRALIQPDGDTVVGSIDGPAWQQTEQIMLTHGQIKAPVQVERFLKPVADR